MEFIRLVIMLAVAAIVGISAGKFKVFTRDDLQILDPRNWTIKARKIAKALIGGSILAVLLYAVSPFVIIGVKTATGGAPLIDPDAHPAIQVIIHFPWAAVILLGTLPILEEWVFRHVLFRKMLKYGFVVAMLSSSFIFGFFHLVNGGTYLGAIVPPFVGGLFFSVAYVRGGFAMACAAHIIYNELILLVMWM